MTKHSRLRRGLVAALVALAATTGVVAVTGVVAGTAHAAAAPGNLLNGSGLCLGSFPGPQPYERLGPCNTSMPAQAWTTVPLINGAYQILDGSKACLSVQGASTGDGAWVDYETCNGTTAQEWTPLNALPGDPNHSYQLVNANSGKCLGIYHASTQEGYPAVQWDCQSNAPNQRWNGTLFFGVVTDATNGQCVGVNGASTAQGASILEWDCQGGSANQAWELDPTTGRLQNSSDGMCMGVLGASMLDGAPIVQWGCNTSNDQDWVFQPQTGTAGFFRDVHSGKCLTAPGPHAQLEQETCGSVTTGDQLWTFTTSSRGA